MGFGSIIKRNDTFTAFRYKVIGANASARRFYIYGDQAQAIKPGQTIRIGASSTNNGLYTVSSVAFETSTNRTRVNVKEEVASSASDGVLDLTTKDLPWQTGDAVVVSSTKFLPSPLLPNTAYYVIRKNNTQFKLAETKMDAMDGISIQYKSIGDGFLTVAQIESSFRVFAGAGNTGELWFHYATDKEDVRVLTAPQVILGMQTLINIVDGYGKYQEGTGLPQNIADSNDFDPVTGRLVNWQLETERFIDWAFGFRSARMVVTDQYHVAVSPSTDTLTFASSVPMWLNGTAVSVAATGTLPSPLIAGSKYFVVLTDTPGQIKLSTSPTISDTSAYVDITTGGSGTISIGLYDKQRAFPRFEINANRNNLFVDTPVGVLSNVITGPYSDIRVQQSIFDQYNRPITANNLTVYREDTRSHLAMRPEVANDVDPIYSNDPYNYIHFGGAHLFVEGYEHFLLLNDYTVSGALLFDPFLGLSTKKYNVDYFEKTDYTLRPTLGGYYLIDQTFKRNMEGAATDLQNLYDMLALSEASTMAQHSRALVGYKGRTSFLDLLNINSKSQFMFYRGMIQSKGSINSVKAYINSRRFVDAQLDEFWAWKIADFGDARPKVHPELNLFLNDGRGDIRLEFVGNTEPTSGDPDVEAEFKESKAKGFNVVTVKDSDRWFESPDQRSRIKSPLFLDAEVTTMNTIYCGTDAPPATKESTIDLWFNTSTNAMFSFNTETNAWDVDQSPRVTVNGTNVYFELDTICDDVRVVKRSFVGSNFDDFTSAQLSVGTDFKRVNSKLVSFAAGSLPGLITIFTINPASSKISPARLVDKQSKAVLQTVPVWHPAKGDHNAQAMREIDLDRMSDPAHYTTTLNASGDNLVFNPWNRAEKGRVWWDKSRADYIAYHDDKIYPNINDRLRLWGQLAPWGSIDVYEWVESTVPPHRWNDTVVAQATDSSIPHYKKATGEARKTVFKRTRKQHEFTVDANRIVVAQDVLAEDQVVLFASEGSLPAGIEPETKYLVKNLTDGTTFDVVEYDTGESVDVGTAGTDTMYVTPEFNPSDWKKHTFKHERTYAPAMASVSNVIGNVSHNVVFPYAVFPTDAPRVAWIPKDIAQWDFGSDSDTPDLVDVYVNFKLIESGLPVQKNGSALFVQLSESLVVHEQDIIDIIRPIHTPTEEQLGFDPDLSDDGSTLVQWKEDYEYTISTQTTVNTYGESSSRTFYYFWVKDTTTRDETINGSLSVKQAVTYLTETPTPYFVVQKPKDDQGAISLYQTTDFVEQTYVQMPIFYRQLIVQKVASYVDDDNRYTIQFSRDLSLRDNLNEYHRDVNVKDSHKQWVLFRKEQTSAVDYRLWDKLTQALVGYRVDNQGNKIRVPSLERELYDATHDGVTRIGLADDQAFVDRELGISTVLSYLKDPGNDFSPANIDDFFSDHSFDTPESIRVAMDEIYATFGATHVNKIWFDVLHDSLALNRKYPDLMKTSWIALHGVRILEVGGLFDD